MMTRPGTRGGGSQALRFTRVLLRNWRNFRDAEVALQRRAFVIGPNASGKSNLLDALPSRREGDSGRYAAFSPARRPNW
jgi:recombinational DNA repair ATPase RecF